MFSKKKTECRVCGYRFTPDRENIYTAEEPRSALEMLTAAPTRFSAVDCPICGCQIRLADRAPRIDFPAIVERHDADAEETEDEAECSLFRRGLGTPATRAAILEKLVQTGFVQRNGRQITPTKNGILLVSVLPDTLISAQLTAEWENQLSLISKGKSSPKEFMQGIKSMITELTQRYREFDSARENPFKPEIKNNSLEV